MTKSWWGLMRLQVMWCPGATLSLSPRMWSLQSLAFLVSSLVDEPASLTVPSQHAFCQECFYLNSTFSCFFSVNTNTSTHSQNLSSFIYWCHFSLLLSICHCLTYYVYLCLCVCIYVYCAYPQLEGIPQGQIFGFYLPLYSWCIDQQCQIFSLQLMCLINEKTRNHCSKCICKWNCQHYRIFP